MYLLRNGAICGPKELYVSAFTSRDRQRLVDELNHLLDNVQSKDEAIRHLESRLEILGTTQNGAPAVRLDGVVYHAIFERLAEMVDSQRKALDGTSYQTGVINGLLMVESVVLGTQPKLVEAKPLRTHSGKIARLEGERIHLEAEVKHLRACLQEIADTLNTDDRARNHVRKVDEILNRYSQPQDLLEERPEVIEVKSGRMVASIKCDTRGDTLRVGVLENGQQVAAGMGLGEDNPFVDTITEAELTSALNATGMDSDMGAPDRELAKTLFRQVLDSRGVHCTAHVDYAPQVDGKPELSAAGVFQCGSSQQILDYLQSTIKDTVLGCALKTGSQPVPPQELRLWSEYDLREVIRDELTANGLPVTHS